MAKKRNETPKIEVEKAKYLGKHYRILFAPTINELEEEVDKTIAKSWRVSGGVAADSKGFYQSMCKGA